MPFLRVPGSDPTVELSTWQIKTIDTSIQKTLNVLTTEQIGSIALSGES